MTLVILLSLVSLLATALSVFALIRATSRRYLDHRDTRPSSSLPPVTVLKPLCGADDDLEHNLETFFVQTHPHFELVFGVQGDTDPAIPVVQRLMARHPAVTARLVVHPGGRALNPKVDNLLHMMAGGTHDLVVVSDSNLAVTPTWLDELATTFASDARHGLVMNLFAGVGEETLGATLDNLHLAGPVAGSLAVSHVVLSDARLVGKSFMMSRAALDSLGGLESVGTVLAEDFVLGRMFSAAGYKVAIAPTVVANVTRRATLTRFLSRQLRWSLLRSRLTPSAYLLEPLINPMLPAVLAPLTGPLMPLFFFGGLALTFFRDGAQWLRLRGASGLGSALPLGPAKELALLAVWALAPLTSRVTWRGKRFTIAAGTRLYAQGPRRPRVTPQWQ